MKNILAAGLVLAFATTGTALAADKYVLDSSHSQVMFEYNHLGFSTTYGMFSGFTGEIMLDTENPASSSVSVSMNIDDVMFTGWDKRDGHFKSPDFFNVEKFPVASFKSTSVEVTGEDTAKVTGDLTILDQTKSVTLDAKLNKMGKHPQQQKDWVGFDASTTIKRTDFALGKFAPWVSDEVVLSISVEAGKE